MTGARQLIMKKGEVHKGWNENYSCSLLHALKITISLLPF